MTRFTLRKSCRITFVIVVATALALYFLVFKSSRGSVTNNILISGTYSTLSQHAATHDPQSERIDWHNYTQINEEAKRTGPGEQGTGLRVPKSEEKEEQAIYRENGYNGYVSDKISLQRSLHDIRHADCRNKTYFRNLPSVSLIIPFHQEHWSPLIRTIDSAIRRSPAGLIKEVILVDDASRKSFLMKQLEVYLTQHYPIARVVRTNGRQGLIRTRVIGAKEAKYDVLIFLDSHCEANVNWLPPLLDPIVNDYRTVTCPFIDVVNMDTFEYVPQDEGARGAFDWILNYKRLPRLKSDDSHPSDPFESPVMAGGLFAISRRWFWELGGYDEGLDIWGGEQYELSFKLWQCGGKMLDIPCSRLGHVYRKFSPFPNNAKGNFLIRNYKRVAMVWMDEYKEYLYLRRPEMKNEDPLDLTKQMAIREKLHCKNFSWFMNEVAFDLVKRFPLVEPPPACSGEVRLQSSNESGPLCIDFKHGDTGYHVGLSTCLSVDPNPGGEQNLILSWKGDIHPPRREQCLDCSDHQPNGALLLFSCHGIKGNQFFKYNVQTKQIIAALSSLCVEGHVDSKKLSVQNCDPKSDNQRWIWTDVNQAEVQKVFNLKQNDE